MITRFPGVEVQKLFLWVPECRVQCIPARSIGSLTTT